LSGKLRQLALTPQACTRRPPPVAPAVEVDFQESTRKYFEHKPFILNGSAAAQRISFRLIFARIRWFTVLQLHYMLWSSIRELAARASGRYQAAVRSAPWVRPARPNMR
jgi:hypothetical protein